MSKKGFGYAASNRSKTESYGEGRIFGHTESGDGMSMRIQSADVKKVLGSVHKMNVGGTAVVLDGNKSYMQNREPG